MNRTFLATALIMALLGPMVLAAGVDDTHDHAFRVPNVSVVPTDSDESFTYLLEAYNASDTLIMSLTPAGAFALTATFTLTGAFTMSGDLTVSGADIQLGATGVKISSDNDGAITFLGCSAGADEDVTINLDDTADEITLSTSTSATLVDLDGALDLEISGNDLQLGETGVKFTSDGDGAVTLLGCSAGADEDLTINLDDTANEATITSSTDADINFSAQKVTATLGATDKVHVNGATTRTGTTECLDVDAAIDTTTATADVPAVTVTPVRVVGDTGGTHGVEVAVTTGNQANGEVSSAFKGSFDSQLSDTATGIAAAFYAATPTVTSNSCSDYGLYVVSGYDTSIYADGGATITGAISAATTAGVDVAIGNSTGNFAVTSDNADFTLTDATDDAFQITSAGGTMIDVDYGAADTITIGNASDAVVIVSSGLDLDSSGNLSNVGTVGCGAITSTGTSTFGDAASPDSADGAALGSTSAEWSDLYLADGGKIYLGSSQEIAMTHVHDDGILLGTTCELQFYDSTEKIASTGNGLLTLSAATSIAVAAGDVDDYWNFKASGNNPIMEVVGSGNGYIEFAGGVLYLGDGSNTMASFTDSGTTVAAVINGSLGVNTTLTVAGDAAINGEDITADGAYLGVTTNSKTFKYALMPMALGSGATDLDIRGIASPLQCVGIGGTVETGAVEGSVELGDAADFLLFSFPIPETFADTTGATGELVLAFDILETAGEEVNLEVRVFQYASTTPIFTDTITVANGAARAWVYMDTLGAQGIDEDADVGAGDVLIVEITQEGSDNNEDCSIFAARLKYRVGFTNEL